MGIPGQGCPLIPNEACHSDRLFEQPSKLSGDLKTGAPRPMAAAEAIDLQPEQPMIRPEGKWLC